MPNWCQNNLKIEGPHEKVLNFFTFIKGDKPDEDGEILQFDFSKIIPIPESLIITSPAQEKDKDIAKSNLEKYGYENWYGWIVANWGTKWNARDVYINNTSVGDYGIYFTTAWSPPNPIIKKLGILFPDLTFTLSYFEPGAGFAGIHTVEGEESNDEYTEDENSVKQIGEDEFGEESEDFEIEA